MRVRLEQWKLQAPFRISARVFDSIDLLVVELEKDGAIGRGEAAGVYFRDDLPSSMLGRLAALRPTVEAGLSRQQLQELLPAGGARNALDCALWELESCLAQRPVWQLAGVRSPEPLTTTFGCGADTPERMAAVARGYGEVRAIKLKLTGEAVDADRVRAVRDTLPAVWLSVDANQGFTRPFLEELMPTLLEARVSLIEQPFPIGQDRLLDGLSSPIPIAADESVLTRQELPQLARRFDIINIKLDKCGGLTEALEMARMAHSLGMDAMVGNMFGTSLGMAPAYILGQLCTVVDLDGPLFLEGDRASRVAYQDGLIQCPPEVWGWVG